MAYLQNETNESYIAFGDYHYIQIESTVTYEIEDDVTSGPPDNWSEGYSEPVEQVSLIVKCSTLDTDYLTKNITTEMIWKAFNDGGYSEIYDDSVIDFYGKDKDDNND